MAMTQNERNKKYNQKFKRTDLRIKKEDFEVYNNHIRSKGYNSFTDFINTIIAVDLIDNNIIPDKQRLDGLLSNTATEDSTSNK